MAIQEISIAELETLRAEIAALKQDKRRVESEVKRDKPEAQESVDTLVNSAARQAQLSGLTAHLITPQGGLGLNDIRAWTERLGLFPVLCALCPDQVAASLKQSVASHYRAGDGLPHADRATQISLIETALTQAERDEEQMVRALETQGIKVRRRADADPAIVLGII